MIAALLSKARGSIGKARALRRPAAWREIGARLASSSFERRAALVLAVLSVLFAGATFFAIAAYPTNAIGAGALLALLNIDLALLLLLGLVIGRRVVRLLVERRRGKAGSRLHTRLVGLFAVVAAVPAILVTIFSILFLSAGLESWFSDRVRNALQNGLAVSRAYLEEHKQTILADALATAAYLEREAAWLYGRPDRLQSALEAQVTVRALAEAILFAADGRIISRTGLSFRNPLDEISQAELEDMEQGEARVLPASDDRVRAVVRLSSFQPAYLFLGRFVDPTVLGYVQRSQSIADDYDELALRRSDIQIAFSLIFALVTLLVLFSAVWVGLGLADQLATPIMRLMAAADRVSSGDLRARVPVPGDESDLADLSRAFNRMTRQIADQRKDVLAANLELDERRRFIEAVLADISPGVLSLDPDGRVVLANAAASRLLERRIGGLIGMDAAALLPEIGPHLTALAEDPARAATAEIDHVGTVRRKLLARLSPREEGGGYVLTFDDVTELVEAQKQAAWADVARRLAHEIKNPLTPIRLSAERLSRRFAAKIDADRELFDNILDVIKEQVDVIGRLIDEFSAYARMPGPVMREVDLRAVVAGVIELHRGVHGDGSIDFLAPEEPVIAAIDRHKITQALTNLVRNAFDASLSAPSSAQEGDAGPDVAIALLREGSRIVVEVGDRGSGFDPELRNRLLEPYVTTKSEGSGLGLAIVKKIMDEHGGAVQLLDRPGGGALVRLVLPSAEGASEQGAKTLSA